VHIVRAEVTLRLTVQIRGRRLSVITVEENIMREIGSVYTGLGRLQVYWAELCIIRDGAED